jgi:hypothetical protein
MSENGKGDTRRPLSVDQKTFSSNWERAFSTPQETCEYSGLPNTSSYGEMDKKYAEIRDSGLFWELFPDLTGHWETDKLRWNMVHKS